MSNIPTSSFPIQQEAAETSSPTSESLFFSIGGAVNYCLINISKVGDIIASFLDQSTFQAQHDATWVLCDGRNVTGSDFNTLTGLTNVPDMRGTVMRAKDNGRGLDPHGDQAIGTYQPDQMLEHKHDLGLGVTTFGNPYGTNGSSFFAVDGHAESFSTAIPFVSPPVPNNTGGATTTPSETNAKGTVVNFFTKINV